MAGQGETVRQWATATMECQLVQEVVAIGVEEAPCILFVKSGMLLSCKHCEREFVRIHAVFGRHEA